MLNTQSKIIVSGSLCEVFWYDHYFEVKEEFGYKRRLGSSAVSLRRLMSANMGEWFNEEKCEYYLPIFLTLTFADNVTDLTIANKEFKKFHEKFSRLVFHGKRNKLEYIAVPEFQQRGAVHYHLVVFNLPYVDNIYDVLVRVWGHGYVLVKSVKNVDARLAFYFSKYFSKGNGDNRFYRRRRYFGSKNLLLPYFSYELKFLLDFVENVGTPVYQSEFIGFNDNQCRYEIYDISDSALRGLLGVKRVRDVIPVASEDVFSEKVGNDIQGLLFI